MTARNDDDSSSRRRQKVRDILEYDAAATPRPRRRKSATSIGVSGDNNIVGNNNTVTVIKTDRIIKREIVKPQPGVEHITEEQFAKLRNLIDEIIRVESLTKRDPATHQRVWGALARKMDVVSNRMIKFEKFPAAEMFLRQWLGRLSTAKSVIKYDDGLRTRRIKYIQTNMKVLLIEDQVRKYMMSKFGAQSLTELDQPQLDQVYRYIAGLKRRPGS
ncbi:hypothetical protein HL658_31145 [Azospirillum sp. RWY-5-1]|uniref:Uncharacterized protein n=1 Tax=Azospirillum oleiclasticum TaxID=2735135 RepID=A0ABX2TLE5_9PROT|nr:hypothetical protein [Azospirillum oleiclasticum]NYZ17021.1 hypothetical protein [Azospirillum oleiclasticum]NYZ24535.1 hypothetical protein [Azospirillum oleiclasticum]